MRRYISKKIKDKSGQDMVEFTFVLPLLMFCFVFILTGGQLVYNKFVVYNATINALRQASTENKYTSAATTYYTTVKNYAGQAICIQPIAQSDTTIEVRDKAGNNPGARWKRDNQLVGKTVFHVRTLFPVNFKGLQAANIMNVSGESATYIEYDDSNGSYDGNK